MRVVNNGLESLAVITLNALGRKLMGNDSL